MVSIRHDDRPFQPRTPSPSPRDRQSAGGSADEDRRPAWVRRLDDHIVVAPALPAAPRVERPLR